MRLSSGGTKIVSPVEFPGATVIQHRRTVHDSTALRKVHGNKTEQFQITASFPLLNP